MLCVQAHHEAREPHLSVNVGMTTGSREAALGSGVWREARSVEATTGPANEEMTAILIAMAMNDPEASRPETPPMTAGVAMATVNDGTTGIEVRDLLIAAWLLTGCVVGKNAFRGISNCISFKSLNLICAELTFYYFKVQSVFYMY